MSRKDGEKLNIIYYSLCFPNDDGDEDDGDEEEEELNIVFFPLYFPFSHPRQGGIRFNTANMMSLFWGYFLVHPWPIGQY